MLPTSFTTSQWPSLQTAVILWSLIAGSRWCRFWKGCTFNRGGRSSRASGVRYQPTLPDICDPPYKVPWSSRIPTRIYNVPCTEEFTLSTTVVDIILIIPYVFTPSAISPWPSLLTAMNVPPEFHCRITLVPVLKLLNFQLWRLALSWSDCMLLPYLSFLRDPPCWRLWPSTSLTAESRRYQFWRGFTFHSGGGGSTNFVCQTVCFQLLLRCIVLSSPPDRCDLLQQARPVASPRHLGSPPVNG